MARKLLSYDKDKGITRQYIPSRTKAVAPLQSSLQYITGIIPLHLMFDCQHKLLFVALLSLLATLWINYLYFSFPEDNNLLKKVNRKHLQHKNNFKPKNKIKTKNKILIYFEQVIIYTSFILKFRTQYLSDNIIGQRILSRVI